MSFADSFWSQDYDKGFKVLFEQLYEGVNEDEDFINLFTARMESELLYGTQLESIGEQSSKNSSKRQTNDDYVSSIKNSFQKMNENFQRQGDLHIQTASQIKQLVLDPFAKWCREHKQRVEFSEDTLLEKHKAFKQAKVQLEKIQKKYFNKCRMLEEFKGHYTEEELEEELDAVDSEKEESEEASSAKDASKVATVTSTSSNGTKNSSETGHDVSAETSATSGHEEGDEKVYHIGHLTYDSNSIKSLLSSILRSIPTSSHKVAILGTYDNVSTGSAITQWLLDNKQEDFKSNLEKAEAFGQDLLNHGFIRLIGSMNKNFINSSQFHYQWKPLAFELSGMGGPGIPSSEEAGSRTGSRSISRSGSGVAGTPSSAVNSAAFSDYLEDMKLAIGVNTIDFNDRSQLSKLIKDVNQLDAQYFEATLELDSLRCEYEETIMDHLTFMQKCELDRMKAVKKATFDFLSCFANKVATLKSTCDELLIIEETIQPFNDLKFLIENYQTGRFKPQVILYDNYYNSNIRQTFGVDLATKSRLDRKVVPIILQCLLSYLDKVYPDLENDEERVNLWIKPVHLNQVHQLRFKLNELIDPQKINAILNGSETPSGNPVHPLVVTNLFKLYFMELPDSVVPHSVYDLIKSLYLNYPFGSSEQSINDSRINGLQNVLVDLPKCNVATLDAILTHLTRLAQIIGSKNEGLALEFKTKLSKEFGALILRPKVGDFALDNYVHDKHQVHFMNDLFEHKERIFKELRRRASTRVSSSASSNLNGPSGPTSTSAAGSALSATSAPKRAATVSKNRLESRLQNAVHKKLDPKLAKALPEEPTGDASSPSSGSSSHTNSLKRSTSPTKKKNSGTTSTKQDAELAASIVKKSSPPIVSSRPSKKDIGFDHSNSSSDSLKEFGQPKFLGSLGRKTSVKDLASRFDSPSPEKKSSET